MKEQSAEKGDTTKLADALNFLCSQKRTGKLLMSEKGREGEIFLADGRITHAQCGQCTGLQALFFMLSWERGACTFTPKETTDYITIEMETSRVLSLVSKRTREWSLISEGTSLNLNAILSLLPQATGTIRLKKEEWAILARIDGKKSLQEISHEMYAAPLDVVKAIQRFREAGLIGEGIRYPETTDAILRRDFLAALEQELNLAIGPIAPLVLEEALHDLGEVAATLTEDKIDILLERLSKIIPLEENRSRFQQAVRALIIAFFKMEEDKEGTKE
jgi:DNA-binding MarR family transcriptional regulator